MANAPGKSYREGISLLDLAEMFPDEAAAIAWFEQTMWPDGRVCGHCGSDETKEVPNAKPMPYWCKDCRSYFSVRTGTAIEKSRLPLQKWVWAIFLNVTSLKSVSSMKLHRDLGVTQKTAWFMQHRLREAWAGRAEAPFSGPVEVDETYIGGKRKNKSNAERKALREAGAGRGGYDKEAVVGAKDRLSNAIAVQHIEKTDQPTLQGFVEEHTVPDATVYTVDQMDDVVAGMVGRRLLYRDLVSD